MRRGALLRVGWNLGDQVLSSATNALLSFLVARSVTETEFGGFSIAFTVFSVLVGLSRAVSSSPLSVRFAGKDDRLFRPAGAASVGTALVVGAVGGVGCLVAGSLLDGAAGTALLALGVVLPGLLVQDAWRFVFFAEARPQAAVVNDALWAVLQIGAVLALVAADLGTVGPLLLAWGGAACAAALLGLRQAGVRPAPRSAVTWLRRHWDLSRYLLLEYVTLQGGMQLALLCIASIGTLSAVGALRGVQVLLGPTTILAVGIQSFALPELSRRRRDLSARRWVLAAVALSGLVTGMGVLWGALFLLVPDAWGRELLGDTWATTSQILVASIVQQAGAAIALGPAVALYAMDRARVTLSIHAVLAPLMFLGGVGGVVVGGAQGAAWGFALAYWSVAPVWWVRVRREARRLAGASAQHHAGT
ncbi:Membrane protein involved in the export of O-antigen and teichoic acid [Nocardioides scoriae]|uniref:Membrane protein involved in the export of O-antigen and teichoic acid n=1 Tax=Nocardioides scoriae TaxID=642780 RepID=A0A1H1TGD9_9ACTN|nr:hypothetical protein [Nocardioides scoriae]SDS59258.1 Membrane protein involved in the export of O-antigen and teichoic acid [Nocardioides scoriae]